MTQTRTETLALTDGTELRLTVAEPENVVRGGLVVLHEARGVTDRVRRLTSSLAEEGWLVLHDLTLPGWLGSLEHLVVGPTGVWVMASWQRQGQPAGPAVPGFPQSYTIHAEQAFFIDGFDCHVECDGDGRNPVVLRAPVRASDFAAAVTATDITAFGGWRNYLAR